MFTYNLPLFSISLLMSPFKTTLNFHKHFLSLQSRILCTFHLVLCGKKERSTERKNHLPPPLSTPHSYLRQVIRHYVTKGLPLRDIR